MTQPIQVKGKGFINNQGYKVIYPFGDGRHILEHRFIMEKFLKRKLEKNEIVHHINHKKLDNRIRNLEVIEWGKHSTHHNKKNFGCKVADCKNNHCGFGYCKNHYRAFKIYGDPLYRGKCKTREFVPCSQKDCPNRHAAKGLCFAHYNREQRRIAGVPTRIKRRTLP